MFGDLLLDCIDFHYNIDSFSDWVHNQYSYYFHLQKSLKTVDIFLYQNTIIIILQKKKLFWYNIAREFCARSLVLNPHLITFQFWKSVMFELFSSSFFEMLKT